MRARGREIEREREREREERERERERAEVGAKSSFADSGWKLERIDDEINGGKRGRNGQHEIDGDMESRQNNRERRDRHTPVKANRKRMKES